MPTQVAKLLLPYEEVVLMTRRHPASIAGPLVAVVAGLLVAIALSATVASPYGPVQVAIWVIWSVLFLWALWRYVDWRCTYFLATKNRLLLKTGVLRTRVPTLPLGKVQDLTFDQSFIARTWGYATFDFETAGQDQSLRKIEFVPYGDRIYLELMSLLFPDPNDGAEDPPTADVPGEDPGT